MNDALPTSRQQPRRSLRHRRQAARCLHRQTLSQRVHQPVQKDRHRAPLSPTPLSAVRKHLAVVGILLAAVVAHTAVLAVAWALATLAGPRPHRGTNHEPVTVTMLDVTTPPVAPVESPAPETAKRLIKPLPQPAPKAHVIEPPPDPTTAPPPTPQPSPTEKPARRVVGLSLSSTVTGGNGPTFAVGNTRMGSTAAVAQAPSSIAPLAAAPTTQGPATRIPVAGVTFTAPSKKHSVEPTYPAAQKSLGIEADVVLMADLDAQGQVSRITLIQGAADASFNDAAIAAARAESYTPATRDGVAVPYRITFTVRFRLTHS